MNYDQLSAIASELCAEQKIDRIDPDAMRERLIEAEATIAKRGIAGMVSPAALPFLMVLMVIDEMKADTHHQEWLDS